MITIDPKEVSKHLETDFLQYRFYAQFFYPRNRGCASVRLTCTSKEAYNLYTNAKEVWWALDGGYDRYFRYGNLDARFLPARFYEYTDTPY